MSRFVSHTPRALVAACVVAAGFALAVATACGPGATGASFQTAIDTLTIFAINGTAPSDPSALDMASGGIVVPNGTCNFDFAFDINAANNAVIYPVRFICTDLGAATRQVGLQRSAVPFDSVQYAPLHGYVFDSAMVMLPGQTLLLATLAPGCVTFSDPALYAKLVLDSINLQNRTIFARADIDPNCGFRSLLPGLPTR
jgi:hypothetical protein